MGGTANATGGGESVATPQNADTVPGVQATGSWTGDFDPAKNLYLNINAFALPAAYRFGTSSLFIPGLTSPFYLNEDLGLIKKTRITERVTLDVRIEAFNAFNRVMFGSPATNLNTPQTFGKITSVANSARNGQIAAKITF